MNGEKVGLVIIGLPSAKDAEYAPSIQHAAYVIPAVFSWIGFLFQLLSICHSYSVENTVRGVHDQFVFARKLLNIHDITAWAIIISLTVPISPTCQPRY